MSTNLPLAPKVYQDKLLTLSNFIFRFLRVAQQLTIDRTGMIALLTTALFIIFFAVAWLLSTPRTFHPRSDPRRDPARSDCWSFKTGIHVTAANLLCASRQVSANIPRPSICVIDRTRCIYTSSPAINGNAANPDAVADLPVGAFSAFIRHMIVRPHASRPTLVLPTSSLAAQWSSQLLEGNDHEIPDSPMPSTKERREAG